MFDGLVAAVSRMIRPKARHQIPQLDLLDRLFGQVPLPLGQVAGLPRVVLLPLAAPLVEHAGRVAVLLVLQQPADQFLPRVVDLVLHLVAAGQHLLRLDLDEHAAMARKSPTALTSNCSSTARYSRYWSVIAAMGMSMISTSCLRTR